MPLPQSKTVGATKSMKCFRCLTTEVREVLFCRGRRETLRASRIDPAMLTTTSPGAACGWLAPGGLCRSIEEFQKALETNGKARRLQEP